MEVGNRLPCVFATVRHHSETINAQLLGDLGDDCENMGNHCVVLLGDGSAGGNVNLGNHQEVGGCLGVDVVEGVAEGVLVHLVGGNLSLGNFTK